MALNALLTWLIQHQPARAGDLLLAVLVSLATLMMAFCFAILETYARMHEALVQSTGARVGKRN
jgi:hypothetical protein